MASEQRHSRRNEIQELRKAATQWRDSSDDRQSGLTKVPCDEQEGEAAECPRASQETAGAEWRTRALASEMRVRALEGKLQDNMDAIDMQLMQVTCRAHSAEQQVESLQRGWAEAEAARARAIQDRQEGERELHELVGRMQEGLEERDAQIHALREVLGKEQTRGHEQMAMMDEAVPELAGGRALQDSTQEEGMAHRGELAAMLFHAQEELRVAQA